MNRRNMSERIYPPKLMAGDEVRIIAPSRSFTSIAESVKRIANTKLTELGLELTFGKHINEKDNFDSSSIESRVKDLHEAFGDKKVKAIITASGGFNSNQLLTYLDWDLIQKNPKIFCGYSDITALSNALYAKTGLVSYSGPNYSTFGQEPHWEYTFEYFKKCLFSNDPFAVQSSKEWSDYPVGHHQGKGKLIDNEGFWIINEGRATGTIVGGTLCTFSLLKGTEYFPSLDNSFLFLEDAGHSSPHIFDRDLQALLHLPASKGVRGIVIGRFEKASEMAREKMTKIIKTKRELDGLPVIANVDFGHTDPIITFPVGGEVRLQAEERNPILEITKH